MCAQVVQQGEAILKTELRELVRQSVEETLNGSHQDGLTTNGEELLGDVSPHAQSLAPSYDDNGLHKSLYIMPAFNASAASFPQKCSTRR